jgi:hypothetical protein
VTADRSSLLAAKLRALVAAHFGPGERRELDFPSGAGLVADGVAWVLLDSSPLQSFGAALVWGDRHGASELHLLVDDPADAGVLSRRAGCFEPAPSVWVVEGTSLVPARPAPPSVPVAALTAPELAELLVDADLEVVVEEGIVRGEVNGLEVARIVHDTSSTGVPLDGPLLEVGVGHADREMTALIHGSMSPVDQLTRVAEIVRGHRQADAEPHPLKRLAPERWLRARLIANPERVGLTHLRPVDPAVPRPNLRDRAVAMAVGETASGERRVVACSVGVDLDLVPAAADARLSVAPEAPLLLVVPERDAHPVTRALAARLRAPAEVVTVSDHWRR